MKPYFSLDIETTGLDVFHAEVLEIALVYDDGKSPIDTLPTLRIPIRIQGHSGSYYEPYAMAMNAELLKEISKIVPASLSDIRTQIKKFLSAHSSEKKITYAGKNISGFDLPILRSHLSFDMDAHHRTIDVGSLYWSRFGYIPSLQEINTLIGYKPVSHTALEDAKNVIAAIRWINEKNH